MNAEGKSRKEGDRVNKRLFLFLAAFTLLLSTANAAFVEAQWTESFLVISDTHLTEKSSDHTAMMEAVIQAARGRDAVLLLGDNTNNTHAQEHALALRWAEEIETKTGAQVFILPGNHDYSAHLGPEEFRAQYGAYGWDRAFSQDADTASCAVMTPGGACFLLLDTNQLDASRFVLPDGGIGAETLIWLQEVLKALPEGTPVIACGHHPILPRERNGRTSGALALGQVLRAYGVNLYLCGHDHSFATVERDGLRQITVGQPQAYPGWAGVIEREGGRFAWHTEGIYGAMSDTFLALRAGAEALGSGMARGTLSTTIYAGDEGAVAWFTEAFLLFAGGEMTPEDCARLLSDENCLKWRQAETRTVVKEWILNLLENCPEDMRQITIPQSQKKSPDRS